MKLFLITCLSLALATSSLNVLKIGKSCSSSSPFVVTSFNVSPYPPAAGQNMTVSMSGTFSTTQFVADIVKRVSYNNGRYQLSYVDYSQSCQYGQLYTFNISITAGTQAGIYDNQVGLETKQGSAFSCWDFTYHI